ncbi:tyrosine-type recombinase/integrase [Niallia sp. 01092]|uniref:tyrosine-type recombinase/integrase n=1 Tax=unclassified Niallia TaxID=2837522 RepID=UPI003FD01A8D
MEFVEAIKDIKQINSMKRYLKKISERDYLLFVLGINTGLTITELLDIRVKDLFNGKTIKDFYKINKDHCKEENNIYLNQKVQKAILHYVQTTCLAQDNYLFQSKKTDHHISRQQAYRIIHQAAEAIGLEAKIGTHSMRKTFGYHAYKRGVAISLLQKRFNHSTKQETYNFLGITKEEHSIPRIDVNL